MDNSQQHQLVFTIKERCKVCYTCVRECPAKAIRITGGQAEVIAERCIGCGNCVRVCSQHAKRVLDSTRDLQRILEDPRPAAAIVAPSFPAEFTELHYTEFVGLLRKLGFKYVVEVGFGADLVSNRYKRMIQDTPDMHFISTACPAVIGFIERYHPRLVPHLSPLVSPMIATARAIRRLMEPDMQIVFIGPCIAKKEEAVHPEIPDEVQTALTFTELRQVFATKNLTADHCTPSDFDPPHAGKGALFAISRGLLQAADLPEDLLTGDVVAADGRVDFVEAVKEFEAGHLQTKLLEILSCPGCIMGAGITSELSLFSRRTCVSRYVTERMQRFDDTRWQAAMTACDDLDLTRTYHVSDQRYPSPSDESISDLLKQMGKFSPQDELNCGACGYDTCREHAVAIYKGLAETAMCLPYTIEKLKETLTALDVSSEKLGSAQEVFLQTERMGNLGRLMSSFAGDFNNPIGTILMMTNLLLEEADPDSPNREDLQTIVDQANRCRDIVDNLIRSASNARLSPAVVDIDELADRSVMAVPSPDNVIVEVEHRVEDPAAELDREQILQALTNLLLNAYEAMPDGGKLLVQTTGSEKHVCFTIRDTGSGIQDRHRHRIFEPMFTTKQLGTGAGLGLTVAYNIVKLHHGEITLESNADPERGPTGTVFTIILPRTGLDNFEMDGLAMTQKAKTILVVDDDEDFLFQMKLQLEKSGYNVLTADGESEAEEILTHTLPDLAICDLMMEHRDGGFMLSYHIKKKDPSIPVIMVTAVTSETGMEFDAATPEERAWVKADVVLRKPVRFEQLTREISRLLGDR